MFPFRISKQRVLHRVQWTFFFLGARVTFGVSDFSVVLVDVVVATKLDPVSVLLFCITAFVSCIFSKIVVGVVEPDGVLKSVADKFWINWLAVGSEPKIHASFSSVTGDNRDGELSGVTVPLGSEVGVETHPGVGVGESLCWCWCSWECWCWCWLVSGESWSPHKSVRSLQARTTSNWFSQKGTQYSRI